MFCDIAVAKFCDMELEMCAMILVQFQIYLSIVEQIVPSFLVEFGGTEIVFDNAAKGSG